MVGEQLSLVLHEGSYIEQLTVASSRNRDTHVHIRPVPCRTPKLLDIQFIQAGNGLTSNAQDPTNAIDLGGNKKKKEADESVDGGSNLEKSRTCIHR